MAAGDRVVLGRVLGAFGVQGWSGSSRSPRSFDGLVEQHVVDAVARRARSSADVVVEEWKPHGAALLARVEGISDRDAAEALRGADVTRAARACCRRPTRASTTGAI